MEGTEKINRVEKNEVSERTAGSSTFLSVFSWEQHGGTFHSTSMGGVSTAGGQHTDAAE